LVKRALLSVSNKTGIVEFARGLESLGVDIISTDGTTKVLRGAGIGVTDVSDVTGYPEMMGGRVKTLHPKIHGGLLCLRDSKEQMAEAVKENIALIDLIAVNLYPFEITVSKIGVEPEESIENIDIGGPTLLRSAAKNYRSVTVLSDPADYGHILKELRSNGIVSDSTRATLAVKAFRHTADYDAAIDTYLSSTLLGEEILHLKFTDGVKLRYGENWHQEAYFYKEPEIEGPSLAKAIQLHGKELSYNNYVDADNALQTVIELGNASPTVSIVKHNNPCGLATGSTLIQALNAAWDGDPISAYGSIICTNEIFDLEGATFLNEKFVEIILAPDFKPEALEYLKNKSENLRLLKLPEFRKDLGTKYTYKYIIGGMLKQSRDIGLYEKWESVTDIPYPESKTSLSKFCLKACKATKSNAVALAHEYNPGFFMVLSIGAGQPNRVDSIRKLAATKAVENLRALYGRNKPDIPFEEYRKKKMSECVMASDAFFPFDDSIIHAAENDIRYIISPGGSIRDREVIATANLLGVSMIFTGMRHFLH
jgi:phosphoribosylaminoimidazolecarboxamide formyltransferase/IMP cyclohydrolase